MTKQIESWLEPVKKDPEAFSWFRKQVEDKKGVLEDLLEDLAYTKTIHRYYAKRKSKERFVSNAKTRKYALDEILLRDQIKEFKDIDPIHFLAYGEVFFEKNQEARHSNLVLTAYVREAIGRITDVLHRGDAVFLRGHLGTGKTELAYEAMEVFSFEVHLDQVLWPLLDKAQEEDYREIYQKAYDQVQKETLASPYFISGNKDIRASDLFIEKSLKLKGALEGKSIQKAYKELEALREELADSQEEKEVVNQLYSMKYGNFGTEVIDLSKEVYLAIKEGRPLIIDELNAIPMEHLIALNDLLQKKPGESVYITGIGQVLIKRGFGLIATGNISTESIFYEGTEDLNPAFSSRFISLEYDYLPQNIDDRFAKMEDLGKNQLYQVLISLLTNQDGKLYLPGGLKSMEELYRLAQLAKTTQLIFSNRWYDNGDMDVELREGVISLRHLVRILEEWAFGEKIDLSMALYQGFISSNHNDDDVNLLLELAANYGFFKSSDGWTVKRRGVGEPAPLKEELRSRPYHYLPLDLEEVAREDFLAILFGPLPKWEEVPEELASVYQGQGVDPVEFLDFKNRLQDLEENISLVERMGDQDKDEV